MCQELRLGSAPEPYFRKIGPIYRQVGRQVDRQQTCSCACEICVFFSCVCLCLSSNVSGRKLWVCKPPSWGRSLYLISAGSDWRADSFPYLPDASLFPNTWRPFLSSQSVWRSPEELLWSQSLWSQAGNTGAFPWMKTCFKTDNWGDDTIFNSAFRYCIPNCLV